MPKLVLDVDNLAVSVGNPVSGTIKLSLEKPTALDDIKIQFKGMSMTRIMAFSGASFEATTMADDFVPMGGNNSVGEKHTHVNLTHSLFQHPKGTELPSGEHTFPFIFNVPVFSRCGCPPRIKEYFKEFKIFKGSWKCEPIRSPSGYSNFLLPSSTRRNGFRAIEYKIVAIADRTKFYKRNMSKSVPITVISASFVHAADPSWHIPTPVNGLSRVYKNSTKSRKLPNSYFVSGALPKTSGAMKLMSLGINTFVDVPAVLEVELDRSNVVVFDKFCPRLYITIQVDDVSRIAGILSLALKGLVIIIKSCDEGFSQRHNFVTEPGEIVYFRKDIDLPLEPMSIRGPARFRIDDKVIPDGVDISHVVPDFRIMSLAHHKQEVHVEAEVSYNGGGAKLMEVLVPAVFQSGVDYDLDSRCILPPRYNLADYDLQPQQNRDTRDGNDPFFDE
ncbi:hypothetical protein POJ06DRAFT_18535 [Lipomyces tetrasporus]|uniref:Arrestin-like N-terminal domain-containing protein n=1 Tax=Lipomyces tetrasporus TaxID=54092 RepID=A0AAD7VX13_9ASCO|nr:uncharacterized protein POJ06DRAFT_18535 [Lipomyces tetrasporus]KAJ8104365.1 hypothetical protein POJ06DRAFT_18535 [Lipomyces tetrasporus]